MTLTSESPLTHDEIAEIEAEMKKIVNPDEISRFEYFELPVPMRLS